MYAPAFDRSRPRDGVAFDEGPYLIARHDDADNSSGRGDAVFEEVVAHAGEDEDADDSVAMVFSADTGAGRAHTPQRLNRTNTPQRYALLLLLYHIILTGVPYQVPGIPYPLSKTALLKEQPLLLYCCNTAAAVVRSVWKVRFVPSEPVLLLKKAKMVDRNWRSRTYYYYCNGRAQVQFSAQTSQILPGKYEYLVVCPHNGAAVLEALTLLGNYVRRHVALSAPSADSNFALTGLD